MNIEVKKADLKISKQFSAGKYAIDSTGIIRMMDIGYVPKITAEFGMRFHPILHINKMHTGIDIRVPLDTPVYAMADGIVIISESYPNYGNLIGIDHGCGIISLYAHNSKLLVLEGEWVKKGQMITRSGSTGYSTGPHLHFEVRKNGKPINPRTYFTIG